MKLKFRKQYAILLIACIMAATFHTDRIYAIEVTEHILYTEENPAEETTENNAATDTNTEDTDGADTSTEDIVLQSPSAVLIEGSSGQIIYEKNKDEQRMPASITKIMTLLLIFEELESGKIKLEDKVTVSEHAASMGGSQVFLEPYESQTVDTMIKCISIASANDASVAMAEHIAGSEEAFVQRMNEKAAELGMKNTHFLNCCGLDDDITEGHYSSAYDIALMSRELIMKYPQISEYSTVWMDTITHSTKKGDSEFGLTNTNKLVRTYNGITGLKTGSTSKAKYCLSATASRDGLNFIAVIMGAEVPKMRFEEAAKLLDYGFANCQLYQDANQELSGVPIAIQKGVKEEILTAAKDAFQYVCLKGVDKNTIEKKVTYKKELIAPIAKGDTVGEIVYMLDNQKIGSVDIVASETIEKANYTDYLQKLWKAFLI